MRGKLVKILGRQLFTWVAVVKFLKWPTIGLFGLLAVWIVGGNLLAEQQENKIREEMAEWANKFPKTEPNDSALKLRILLAKLGISSVSSTLYLIDAYTLTHPDFIPSETEGKAFQDIQKELWEYLDEQLAKPNDEIDAPPEKLQQYLESQAAVIEEIINHVRDNEVPRWETDITYIMDGNFYYGSPNYSYLAFIQRIIALDMIEKKRQGQTQAALEMLEVSWKINQSLRDRPDITGQKFALQAGIYPTGVMRKFDNLPVEWQQRLNEHDHRKSLLTSLEGEFIREYYYLQITIDKFYGIVDLDIFFLEKNLTAVLVQIFKPYIRFLLIDNAKVLMRAIRGGTTKLYQQNVCSYDSVEINEDMAWWNISGLNISFINQERQAAQYMLDLELNQKILHVKALAAKKGQWPKSVPNMESLICPGLKWVYQVSPDGKMSISLSEQPEWLLERVKDNRNLPLTYSDRTPPPKKKDSSDRN